LKTGMLADVAVAGTITEQVPGPPETM